MRTLIFGVGVIGSLYGAMLAQADRILCSKAGWQSWKNQNKCLIGKKTDGSAFTHTDMHI